MVKKILPFQEKLKQKIGAVFEAAGFEPSEETIERRTKAIIYTSKANSKNEVGFYVMLRTDRTPGVQISEFNWLRIQVATSKRQFAVVPTPSANVAASIHAKTGWIYEDEAGLQTSLDEIDQIVRSNLSKWFSDQ